MLISRESSRVSRDFMAHSTQSDIARKLNVTRITVSKALRNHPDISAEMKKKSHGNSRTTWIHT